jgi:GTP-binding protein
MKPVVVLVGRPNVGKSTLFNCLTHSRDALVANYPGLTRDRQYGLGKLGDYQYWVVDTGGLSDTRESLNQRMAEQTEIAMDEASHIVHLVDARDGLTATDQFIATALRAYNKPITLAVNKTDGLDLEQACAEFHALGCSSIQPIAAAHGRGVANLMEHLLAGIPQAELRDEQETPPASGVEAIRIALVGKPNVGKSTLINRLVGEPRLLTFDQPGTTRDSIEVPFEKQGQRYILIDTAGLRRRSRVTETVEKFSVVKSLQAIESAHAVILVLDAKQGISEQDASLLGLVLQTGRAVVMAVNKWDGLSPDDKAGIERTLDLRLAFLDFANQHKISALYGTGIGGLMRSVQRAYESAVAKFPTAKLTRLLAQAIQSHQPPLVRGRRIKLRYAHQGGHNPPCIVIHGNQTQHLPDTYKRYLMNYFRRALDLTGTPVLLEFKTGENPYAGRRNQLSPRQQQKRKRLLRHVKKRS